MERLAELFPDEVISLKEYKSFINQPERIQITSQEDINDYDPNTLTSYYNFRVRLPRSAINIKTMQLARASIPNAIPNIPDTETTFWYYALPTVASGNIYEDNAGVPGALTYKFDTIGNIYTPVDVLVPNSFLYFDGSGEVVSDISGCLKLNNTFYRYSIEDALALPAVNVPVYAPNNDLDYWIIYDTPSIAQKTPAYLRYIRMLASTSPPDLLNDDEEQPNDYAINRTFADYDDLVTTLNEACVLDPLLGATIGTPPNTIYLNNQLGTFRFVSGDVSFSYSTKYNKIIFTGQNKAQFIRYLPVAADDQVWMDAAQELQVRDRSNTNFNYFGVQSVVQPYQLYRNLNLRLGFNFVTYPTNKQDFDNMIRPHPRLDGLSLTTTPFTFWDNVATGYCDLVYSSCCHIYTDITGGSTLDSLLNKALLASIPMNTPNLGVGFHSLPLNNPLTKIATQLNEIYIELRTDTGQPFYLGNNAIISLELILTY